MNVTGIVCEYNPLHLGHKKQLDRIRQLRGPECSIVCLMSGNYVQRGAPAIVDKSLRAKAAVLSGADLVLELPVNAALSSAEGFAAEGVRTLSLLCDSLCFGAETADEALLMDTARALLSEDFPPALRRELDTGASFPAARQAALEYMGLNGSILSTPNNILAVEYCKAILSQNSAMAILPIFRGGSYASPLPDAENPSATALRKLLTEGGNWQDYVPREVRDCFRNARLHTLAAGQRAVLARLRTMTEAEFEALPYGSEGLWRKLMHAVRKESTPEEVAAAVKSKRYTRSRIDRMILCAFLGLTREDLRTPAPYVRVLGFNDRGRQILKAARQKADFPNLGQRLDAPWQVTEDRCEALYGLFAEESPDSPAPDARVYVHK